jgi:hypothetical protein
VEPPNSTTLRLSHLPDRIAATWCAAASLADTMRHATPSRGIVRVIAASTAEHAAASIGQAAATACCTVIPERLPAPLWSSVATPTPNALLTSRVQAAFDPWGILNPGLGRHAAAPDV